MEDSPAILRRIRAATQLSLRAMAKELAKHDAPYSHVALSYYETGRTPPPPGLIEKYEHVAETLTALNTTGDPVALLATLGRSDVDRRDFIRNAAYITAGITIPAATIPATRLHVGVNDVDSVRQWVTSLADLDERFGGNFGRSTVAEFCATELPPLLEGTFANDTIRRNMFGAAAEAVYLAGWKSHDVGRDGVAQRYFDNALALARIADPHAHTAWVMRIKCHQAFALGHGAEHIDLAEESCRLAKGRVDPYTEALFTITAARAHAAAGNHRQAQSAITITEQLIQRNPDTPPRWAAPNGPAGGPLLARVHNQIGVTLKALGDHAGAEEKARNGLELWNRDTNPRIWAITLARVAQAQHDQGRLDDAVATWKRVLPHLEGINSHRIAKLKATAHTHITQAA